MAMYLKKGNESLLKLFEKQEFDKAFALRLLETIDDINEPIKDLSGYETTYLAAAVANNNLEAVRFLFDNGVNPNSTDADGTTVFWDLQYLWDEAPVAPVRYAIAKLFLEYGADPNLRDDVDIESLYDYVLFKLVEDSYSDDWEYLRSFFKLLVIYGGGGQGYPKPEFYTSIDKSRADDYQVVLQKADDGYHIELYLLDKEGNIIARI